MSEPEFNPWTCTRCKTKYAITANLDGEGPFKCWVCEHDTVRPVSKEKKDTKPAVTTAPAPSHPTIQAPASVPVQAPAPAPKPVPERPERAEAKPEVNLRALAGDAVEAAGEAGDEGSSFRRPQYLSEAPFGSSKQSEPGDVKRDKRGRVISRASHDRTHPCKCGEMFSAHGLVMHQKFCAACR